MILSYKIGGIITLYERILKERERLQHQINSINSQLKHLPNSKLICSHNGNRVKWYQSDGHTKTYIPKKNRVFAEQLAKKKYLSLLLEDLSHEQRALDFYLNHHSKNTGKAERLFFESPGYHELLSPYFSPQSQLIANWINAPYERNQKYPEQLIHKASSGNLVRSKSEVLIDLYLYTNHIPFRYECALQLGDTTVFPDFTILHPTTGKVYHWEHLGMMDEKHYYQNAFSKLQLYTSYGFIPTINLITTYETKDSPLSSEIIEKTIDFYFK